MQPFQLFLRVDSSHLLADQARTAPDDLGFSDDGLQPQACREVYYLARDPSEQCDLAAEQPAMVAELSRKFLEEAHHTPVRPMP